MGGSLHSSGTARCAPLLLLLTIYYIQLTRGADSGPYSPSSAASATETSPPFSTPDVRELWHRQGVNDARLRQTDYDDQVSFGATLFEPLGYTASSYNYAHLLFRLNFSSIIVQLRYQTDLNSHLRNMLKRVAKDTKYGLTNTRMKESTRVYNRLRQVSQVLIGEGRLVKNEWDDLRATLFGSHLYVREKRFAVMAGVGAICSIFGLFAGFELSNLFDSDSDDYVVHQMEDNQRAILKLGAQLDAMNLTIARIIDHSRLLATIQDVMLLEQYLQAYISLEGETIRKLIRGLYELLQHRLSPDIIKPDILLSALRKLALHADKSGFLLAINHTTDIFQCEASFRTYNEFDGIEIYVHIPIYRPESKLLLYRYIATPQMAVESDNAFMLQSPLNVFAVAKDNTQYFVTDMTHLQTCIKLNEWRFCEKTIIMQKNFSRTCLSSLYMGIDTAWQKCLIEVLPREPLVTPVGRSDFIIYHPKKDSFTVVCGTSIEQVTFVGVQPLHLGPGCRAESGQQQFVFDMSLHFFQNISISGLNLTTISATPLLDRLKDMEEVIVPTLLTSIRYKSWYERIPAWTYAIILLSIVMIFTFLYCLWQRWDDIRGELAPLFTRQPKINLVPATPQMSPPRTPNAPTRAIHDSTQHDVNNDQIQMPFPAPVSGETFSPQTRYLPYRNSNRTLRLRRQGFMPVFIRQSMLNLPIRPSRSSSMGRLDNTADNVSIEKFVNIIPRQQLTTRTSFRNSPRISRSSSIHSCNHPLDLTAAKSNVRLTAAQIHENPYIFAQQSLQDMAASAAQNSGASMGMSMMAIATAGKQDKSTMLALKNGN